MRATRKIGLIFGGGLVAALVVVGALAAVVVHLSGVKLGTDRQGLARLDVGRFGGTLAQGYVTTSTGKRVALVRSGDVLTPARQLASGKPVHVTVTVKRPGWIGWALGKTKTEHLTLVTPTVAVAGRWLSVKPDGSVRLPMTGAVARVTYTVKDQPSERKYSTPTTTVSLDGADPAGTVRIAASARPWLRPSKSKVVSWFPSSQMPVALVSPKPGTVRGPADPIKLTFSQPVKTLLHGQRPTLSPNVAGTWVVVNSHAIEFKPAGYGAGFGTTIHMTLPRTMEVASSTGTHRTRTKEISFSSSPGSTLRLQQLLADADYLPVDWSPSGDAVARTRAAESQAAVDAPHGHFSWRYSNTPSELKDQWTPGKVDTITKGAIMMFQDEHHLTVDGVAGPDVWTALLNDTIAGKKHDGAYSYVYVHRAVPQRLTLWSGGHTVLTSPGNTGIPEAPTALGTFPVFEHLAVTTMSGTNPDGSHYNDPGIKWVSYFNGGDALHSFNRASFGTPQSLGCVELPLATAAKVWPYTPIGTLVTIEN